MIDKMIEEMKEKMVLEFEQKVAEILYLFSDVTIADFNIKTIEKRLCKKVFDEIAEKYKTKEQTLEQIKWERDCAISQLEELGTTLGEKPEIAKERILEQRWIPVEERLPEEEGKYLCLSKFNSYVRDIYFFTKDAYKLDKYNFAKYNGKNKALFYTYDYEYGYCERYRVIAWMPLPEYHFAEADKKMGGAE